MKCYRGPAAPLPLTVRGQGAREYLATHDPRQYRADRRDASYAAWRAIARARADRRDRATVLLSAERERERATGDRAPDPDATTVRAMSDVASGAEWERERERVRQRATA